jgi:ribosome-associated protein
MVHAGKETGLRLEVFFKIAYGFCMIQATSEIQIDENEIHLDFVRSSGPGGQHVNKVSTAVQLRWDARQSKSISAAVFNRLKKAAGKRLSAEGVLMIHASRFRSQERNRQDALDRFLKLIRKAAEKPKPRRKTRPTKASKERTLAEKKHRSRIKGTRQPVGRGDD